ncbi:hypothetical protein [Kitasatospora sp. A2-31]|uniref:hypothetical protein n=1 Tax=Kitasatospora sp. A2-31 TaxID=2916414 RepID=UPI001EEED92B|nr:hypothetical protein [Kitasatospora sp. A2-31]MCG6498799.1 hypothetical protein [Kitasatospora sp. A2-31]
MSTEGKPLELAHYCSGWIWDSALAGRMKSLLLYFDGFALLLPDNHFREVVAREDRLAGQLRAAGLLHNREPQAWLDADGARLIQESVDRSLISGLAASAEGSRQYRVPLTDHHIGPEDLRAALLAEMGEKGAAVRRRPDLGPDMIEMSQDTSAAVLMALGLAAQRRISDHRLHLVGDLPGSGGRTTAATAEQVGPTSFVLHRDLVDTGVDLSRVPLDEIIDYRREHGSAYRAYARDLRRFVGELEGVEHPADRERLVRDRSEAIGDQAAALRRARRAWGRPLVSLALAGAGAAWTLHQADPVGALVALSGAAAGFTPPAKAPSCFTYLLEARRLA